MLIDLLFGPDLRPYGFKYLDDIVIETDDFERHLEYLNLILIRLIEAELEIKLENNEFCVSSITYLGFMWDRYGLKPDPSKVKPTQLSSTKKLETVEAFLGYG